VRKPTRPQPRSQKAPDGKYTQVERVLDVLHVLKDGPMSTAELSAALNVSDRTAFRFVGVMLRVGWPVLYHKTETSGHLKWDLDPEKLDKLFSRLFSKIRQPRSRS